MQAGRLRERVTIQEKQIVRNSFGEEVIQFVDLATVWAGVEPLNGREFLEAKTEQAQITTRVRIRYRDGIYPTMRLVYRSRVLVVDSVIHVYERQREIVLMCREEINE